MHHEAHLKCLFYMSKCPITGVNRTKVRKVSQDFSIISYINMLGRIGQLSELHRISLNIWGHSIFEAIVKYDIDKL